MDQEPVPESPIHLSSRGRTVGQSMLDDLEQYWRAIRGARWLPVRTDVNPAQIDAILPNSFIMERVAPGVGRLRVAGQSLNAVLGMEARGMPLSVFFTMKSRPVLATCLERVFDGPALVDMPISLPRTLTRSGTTGRLLILPLLGTDGVVSRALGALVMDGPLRQKGPQFAIPDPDAIRIEVQPEPRQSLQATDMASSRTRDHLRLVVSNA